MKINIYYGGRGLIDDTTIFVIDKITEVLEELRVKVERYNLYEEKSSISMLPKTLKDADGVILAASVEWLGIGGNLLQFLDACWLYGDKECISRMHMMPIVTATSYGELEAEQTLIKAWQMLGGIPSRGISAYVENHVDFVSSPEYALMIEKCAEDFYRSISQKMVAFPNSSSSIKKTLLRSSTLSLTPQESEQLSAYVSNDSYVKTQKKDIEDLASFYKGKIETDDEGDTRTYIDDLEEIFVPMYDLKAVFQIDIADEGKSLTIEVDNTNLNCFFDKATNPDVTARVNSRVFKSILAGDMPFQNAFMSGKLSAQGDFNVLRKFDTVFRGGTHKAY
ncbi:SCP2 sterol-binding domain-containing protein [Eubacterium xylanophilum]|uniref:SCP2 sterol-binding domain-containing protein n=1 Tax=Eubacterium xylanophilum TaxID=39497 RepID=UPI00047EE78C|nr:SCP2 sterol-binding domain-containing protein [Eubacterium xylanophilum]